jgi:hypothetical protein
MWVQIQTCADLIFPNRLEREHHERNKANTVAAIERARKLDDEAFANISRPQPKLEPAPESMPVESSAPQTDIHRPSVPTVLKRSILAIHDYFDKHPFWGVPVEPPPTTVVAPHRLGVKLGNLAKHCACGMLGHVVHPSSETGEQPEQKVKVPVVRNEKAPATSEYISVFQRNHLSPSHHSLLFLQTIPNWSLVYPLMVTKGRLRTHRHHKPSRNLRVSIASIF